MRFSSGDDLRHGWDVIVLSFPFIVSVHVYSLSLFLSHCVCDGMSDSKQYMSEAAALLDARKKRKVEERESPPPTKRSTVTNSESSRE